MITLCSRFVPVLVVRKIIAGMEWNEANLMKSFPRIQDEYTFVTQQP